MRQQCINAIKSEQENINKEFPKYKNLTNNVFERITDFANEDFEGVSDNKRYRCFLDLCRDILTTAFEQDAQKSYLRMVFKTLKNEDISKYFSCVMQSRSKDFQVVRDGLVIRFITSWQGMQPYDKDKKLKEFLIYLDNCIRNQF